MIMETKINQNSISINSPHSEKQWQIYYNLRWNVLRRPWGQPKGSERDELEGCAIHLLACVNGHAAGVGRIHSLSEDVARIRYMAVEEKLQLTWVLKLYI